jgi:hypothetical protein
LQSTPIENTRLERKLNPDGRTERFLTEDPDAPQLWARFYELETNRPLYLDRDSKFRFDFSEISYERRSGYSYHGYWPAELIGIEYQQWLENFNPSLIVEAEEGTFEGEVKSSDPGFTGNGFVDTDNKKGVYLEVKVRSSNSGKHMMGIRYAHGKHEIRPAKIEVNGMVVRENLNLMPTGAWTEWMTTSIPVELKKGENVIRLTGTWVNSLPNIDHLKLTAVQ